MFPPGQAALRSGRGGEAAVHGDGQPVHEVRGAQSLGDAGAVQSHRAVRAVRENNARVSILPVGDRAAGLDEANVYRIHTNPHTTPFHVTNTARATK